MLITQCSFCQYQNVPGAHFCAECGSPLHLKVCAQCGKVSEVEAATCGSCGAAFARLDPAMPGVAPNSAEAQEAAPEAAKPSVAPWPLIVMAIVAGGLPLLWLNRAQLPIPKTWQTNRPEAEQALVAPPLPRVAPPPAVAAPPAPPAVLPTPAASEAPVAVIPTTAAPDGVPVARPGVTPKKDPAHRKTAKKPAKTTPAKAGDPARPCTEALAALGLCVPRQADK